jgi:hypothetical protein
MLSIKYEGDVKPYKWGVLINSLIPPYLPFLVKTVIDVFLAAQGVPDGVIYLSLVMRFPPRAVLKYRLFWHGQPLSEG